MSTRNPRGKRQQEALALAELRASDEITATSTAEATRNKVLRSQRLKREFTEKLIELADEAGQQGLTNLAALDVLTQVLCRVATHYNVSKESLFECLARQTKPSYMSVHFSIRIPPLCQGCINGQGGCGDVREGMTCMERSRAAYVKRVYG